MSLQSALGMVPTYRPGQLIVKTTATKTTGLSLALTKVRGRAVEALGRRVSLVEVPVGEELAAAEALEADPAVKYAEPNYVRTVANHQSSELGWGVRSTAAPTLWHRAAGAVTGDGIRVAVLDSGVDRGNPELSGRVDPVRDETGTGPRDDCGHGTAVAGVVAAAAGNGGVVGVAPQARIVPVKVLHFDPFHGCTGDDGALIRGIQWAVDSGDADVINLSLSGPFPNDVLADKIRYATRQGVLVVAAAGNTGDRQVQYPAAYRDVISVGGVQRSSGSTAWWPYTSFAKVDIAAAAKAVPVAFDVDDERAAMVARPCDGPTSWCADGTSFAAPHVAGVAALLLDQHDLDAYASSVKIRRLRQWLLATAPTVPGRRGGLDLATGHGSVNAAAASTASVDATRKLLTWQTSARVIGPTPKMAAATPTVAADVVATTGTGSPLAGVRVTIETEAGGRVVKSSSTTNSGGRLSTTFSSTAGGATTQMTAHLGSTALPMDAFVLQHDENTPGVPMPRSGFRNRLRPPIDIDDVFRVYLRAGETIRASLRGMDNDYEYGELYLHRGGTRDVTDPFLAPLSEPAPYDNKPQELRRTVQTDGRRYVDVYGYGSYRLVWSIYAPRRIRNFDVQPATITPNGDGHRDQARMTWRLVQGGQLRLRITNSNGKVVRRVNFGGETAGARAYRWNGRNDAGNRVAAGKYRATLKWIKGPRVSTARARITVVR